ncbi:hypothetical protein [Yersinia enterocolitica]|nr:hypothetical protein [Yersinia enterocolitica]
MAQIAEVFFILTIPFCLSRFGIKRVSMLAWSFCCVHTYLVGYFRLCFSI